ncbi:MAG: Gfo/Idh/MocA family oxidoreductase [Pontiellaceae bacterium]|nr:Gfo/Idh/MocA family oxidoreductase [Pontiellaceae bacterium]
MKKPSIALIGAGQFGSRHLQGLALCERSLDLFLVDPSRSSREQAQQRFESVSGAERHQIQYLPELDALPDSLDVAIVATSARFRRAVVESLLSLSHVRHLVLEKVLFQSSTDCRKMRTFLESHSAKVWVNAPRRMWHLFDALKLALRDHSITHFSLSVAGWGMACNAYHMLDLFSWLADAPVESLSTDYLDPDPVPARREGFYELTGMLVGRLSSGTRFTITDHPVGRLPFKLMIETDQCCFVVQEGKAEVTVLDGEAPEIASLSGIREQYQSQLSNLLIESLLDSGTCALPTYNEAAAIHEIMLDAFAPIFNRNGLGEGGVCPIT